MTYNQLSFWDESVKNEVKCKGIRTPMELLSFHLRNEDTNSRSWDQLKKIEKELFRLGRIMGKYDWDNNFLEGNLFLIPEKLRDYNLEDFMPKNWVGRVEQIQKRRPIYKMELLTKRGSKKQIVIKGIKEGKWCTCVPYEDWISNCTGIEPQLKSSKEEFNGLLKMINCGIPVEQPVGYFEEGIEQWLYTEFVEGIDSRTVLAYESSRKNFWKADARLLGKLHKSGYIHHGFETSEFDDKVWVSNELVLIDTDETEYVFEKDWGQEIAKNKKERYCFFMQSMSYFTIKKYLENGTMRESEVLDYVKEYLSTVGDTTTNARHVAQSTIDDPLAYYDSLRTKR